MSTFFKSKGFLAILAVVVGIVLILGATVLLGVAENKLAKNKWIL